MRFKGRITGCVSETGQYTYGAAYAMTSADQPSDDASRDVVGTGAPIGGQEALAVSKLSSKLSSSQQKVDHELLAAYDRLLDRYMPASILVSTAYEVVHTFGGAEKYLRYPGGRVSNCIFDLLDDPLQSSVGLGMQHVSQSGEPVSYPNLLYPSAEGRLRLAVAIEPLLGSHGAIDNYLIVFTDITGPTVEPQKRADAKDDIDNLLATTRVGVIFLDQELRVHRFTRGMARVFRLLPDDLGRAVSTLAHNLVYPDLISDLQDVLETRQEKELEVKNTEGNSYFIRISPCLKDDEVAGLVMALIEVENIPRANPDYTSGENEKDFHHTYENAAVGIADLDASGRWVRVNNRLCEIIGYNRDELLGMTFHQLTDPEDLRDDVRQFESLISGELAGYSCESRYHHRDGHIIWVLLTLSRRWDRAGRPAGCLAVIQDISDRKEAEIALQRAKRMADSANRAKSNFVANMSHELRTPMTAILGFADMLADAIDVPEQLEKVKTLKRNAEYLLRLLDDILDLSKIESRRLNRDTKPCDLMGLIDEVEVLMQGRAAQLGNQLSFHFPTQLPKTIYTSGARVRRILVNLIANALRFTSQGEVNVAMRYRLDQCADEEGLPCLEVEVADTAIIDREDQHARAFVPFLQADQRILQRFAGRGSGLSLTKRLVTALGGTIEVACGQDGGNTFRIRLPIGEAGDLELIERATAKPTAQATADLGQLQCIGGKILVADDRRDIWQVTKYFLERCGAEVVVAEDGRQAVDAVRTAAQEGEPFDVLLLDMQMPVMNGLEAVRELRSAGFSLPIIALTADAMKGERQKCLAAGCNDYLTKPIDATLMTETVVKYLGETV